MTEKIFIFICVNVIGILAAAFAVFLLHSLTVWSGPGLDGTNIVEYNSEIAFWTFICTWVGSVICGYSFYALINKAEDTYRRFKG